jgi:hypothetical protein
VQEYSNLVLCYPTPLCPKIIAAVSSIDVANLKTRYYTSATIYKDSNVAALLGLVLNKFFSLL